MGRSRYYSNHMKPIHWRCYIQGSRVTVAVGCGGLAAIEECELKARLKRMEFRAPQGASCEEAAAWNRPESGRILAPGRAGLGRNRIAFSRFGGRFSEILTPQNHEFQTPKCGNSATKKQKKVKSPKTYRPNDATMSDWRAPHVRSTEHRMSH